MPGPNQRPTSGRRTRSSAPRRFTRGKKKSFQRGRQLALKTHQFVERVEATPAIPLNYSTLNLDGNLITTVGISFSLDQIAQSASYSKLFEYYRIDKVICEFRYKTSGNYANSSLSGNPINEINPTLIFKVDHNDIDLDTVPVLMKSTKTKEKQLTNNQPNFSIQIKPAVLTELYKTSLTSAYAPKWDLWLNMDDLGVPHYGLKININMPTPISGVDYGELRLYSKIYFSCKNNE